MIEGIKWNTVKTPEENEKFEQIVSDAIHRIEQGGYTLGEGKTAKVCVLENYPEVCLKMVSEKHISKNRVHKEMEFLDMAVNRGLPVPKPICAIETEGGKDYLFMETVEGFSLKDLVETDLIEKLPREFDFKAFFAELDAIVAKMHGEKIFHRDMHKGNVMVDKKGKPSIIDFGDAVFNHLSSEDPYRETNVKGELTVYPSDEVNVSQAYRQVGIYLKDSGFFESQKGVKSKNEV